MTMQSSLSAPPGAADPATAVRERIIDLARAASYEVSARDTKGIAVAIARLTPGTRVSVTWLPNDDDDNRVQASRRLREAGLEPVPHIAARMVTSKDHLRSLLLRLCDEARVSQLLVISGDVRQASGPFADSAALIASPAFAQPALTHIWVGGYPEGHPKVDDETLNTTLDAKIAAIRARGMTPGVITQFCFDADPILRWILAFRTRHSDVSMRIGLAGPAGIRTLLRFAAICGVGSSAKALVTRGASIARMLSEATPDPIIRDLAETSAYHDLQPLGFHLFPFGGLDRTARWIDTVAAGHFELRSSASGFQVTA
jgi:methylenetetrahydrofolate reductase (NADPH)